MSKLPSTPHVKMPFTPKEKWVTSFLLVTVLLIATLQLVRDLSGVRWNYVFAELPGITQENALSATKPADPVAKQTFISDNYHMCQNKLGVDTLELNGGAITLPSMIRSGGTENIAVPDVDKLMRELFETGVKYFTIKIYSYTPADSDNLVQIIKSATNRQVTAIILPQNEASSDGTGLINLYKNVATQVPNSTFVAGSVNRTLMDQGRWDDAIRIANQVAEGLKDVPQVAVATPEMFVDDVAGVDRVQILSTIGLKLDNFDFMLLDLQNSDSGFDGSAGKERYASDYNLTAYAQFEQIIRRNADGSVTNTYRAKQWLRDNNNQAFRQHMQAIVINFGLKRGTYDTGNNTVGLSELGFQRLEYDFARFGADPDIRAVVFSSGPVPGYALNKNALTRLNLTNTNCNYSVEDSGYTYSDSSAAPVCVTKDTGITNTTSVPYSEARVVCNRDDYTCGATLKFTVQVGMPVKSLGSNSPAGTDTNPYMPISSVVGNSSYIGYLNPYNQYGQRLKASNGSDYVLPWLGNGLYNSAELLRTQFYAASDPKFLSSLSINDLASAAEFQTKLNNDYAFDKQSPYDYRTKTAWCFDALRKDIINVDGGGVNVSLLGHKVLVPREFALFKGKSYCVTKDLSAQLADDFQYYDIDRQSNEFQLVNACNSAVTAVKNDPQNMIYGTEQVVREESWTGSPDRLCYDGWTGGKDLQGTNRLNCALLSNANANQLPAEPVPAGLRCSCNEPGASYSVGAIRNGSCTLSEDKIKWCIDYRGGADSMATSVVTLRKTGMPNGSGNVPTYDVPGAYSAMASLYKHVQTQLASRGLKLIFNEKWGWKSDVIFRAYMSSPVDGTNVSNPRVSLTPAAPTRSYGSLADALGASKSQYTQAAATTATSNSNSGSCKVGVNFGAYASQLGNDKIQQAAQIGYGLGQVIISGPQDATNQQVISTLNNMCGAGIKPVIRSCVNDGNCGFQSGDQQAQTLNSLVSAATACQQVYTVCGHNEPITEFRDGMRAEGAWVRECVSKMDTSGGKAKVIASIFNATYDDGKETVVQHASQFLEGYGISSFNADKNSKISCVGLNTYDNKSNSANDFDRAEYYYNRLLANDALPDLKGVKGCINETGSLDSKSASAMTDLVTRLSAINTVEFILGFNWTGANPDPNWARFVVDDGGRAAVLKACGNSSSGRTISSVGQGNIGTNLSQWDGYLAEGKNWESYNQYYEMLGFMDELVKINDILTNSQLLEGGEIRVAQSGNDVYFQESLAELFAGWYGCGSEAAKAFGENKVNCIGVLGDRDPLGDFLCEKGFGVDENCKLQCIGNPIEVKPITGLSNASCPLKSDRCGQGPLSAFSHYCAGKDPAFDLSSRSDKRLYAPEDGRIVYAVGFEDVSCSRDFNNSLTKDWLISFNEGRANFQQLESIINNATDLTKYDSSGGYFGYRGNSGIYYHFRHLSISKAQVAQIQGLEFKGGQPFSIAGQELELYTPPDNIYNRCWIGAHLHTHAKIGVPESDVKGLGGQYLNQYQLYTDVLGCNSTNGNSCGTGDKACAAPNWVDISNSGVTNGGSGTIQTLQCVVENNPGNGPKENCNEWNCGLRYPTNGNFNASLNCILGLSYIKNLPTDIWVDRYGPYCDNETQGGMPFSFNFFGKFYDKYLPPGTPGGRVCGELTPEFPREEDKGYKCEGGYTDATRQRGDPRYDYYRGALTRCPIPSNQMTWTAQNTFGLSVEALADKMRSEIVYNSARLSNTPRAKLIEVLNRAKSANTNPYVIVGIWATESNFGQYTKQCNVF